MAGPATAVEVSGLFTAEVVVDASAGESRRDGYRAALQSVIARLVVPGAADRDAISEVVGSAEQLVIGYRDGAADRLWVSFDGPTLVALLRQRGVPVWGSDRPLTIVWLAVDRGDGQRDILSSSTEPVRGDRARRAEPADYLRERLERTAEDRGLPVVLPLMDTADRAVIEFADVWGDFDTVLAAASDRYSAVSILAGRAAPGQSEAIRWTWRFGGDTARFTGSVEDAVRRLTGEMGRTLALADPSDVRRVSVMVDAVDDVAAFGRLMSYLTRQPQLKRVDVTGMDGALLELELHYVGPADRVERLLDGTPGLEAVSAPGGIGVAASLTPGLYYRLRR